MSRPVNTRKRLADIRATAREIPAASIRDYLAQWDTDAIQEDIANAPEALVDEAGDLSDGRAVLRLPDGSRWFDLDAVIGSHRDPLVRGMDSLTTSAIARNSRKSASAASSPRRMPNGQRHELERLPTLEVEAADSGLRRFDPRRPGLFDAA